MNISKIRLFPDNEYESYKWDKKERGRWVNIWFKKPDFINKQRKRFPRDEYWTIKRVDEHTTCCLYNRQWNNISISIWPSYRFMKKESIFEFDMKAMIHSVDDSSYGIWFQDKPKSELGYIRKQVMTWIDSQKILNGNEFIKICKNLGGTDEDYN